MRTNTTGSAVLRAQHFLLLLAVALAACSSKPAGVLQLVTGGEDDALTRSPALATLRIDAVDTSGNVQTLATARLPASTIDLGIQSEAAAGSIEVSGLDDSGARLLFGSTLAIQYGALDGLTLPVFVQRTGEMARMPNPLSDARQSPLLAPLAGRYLLIGGGGDEAMRIYDLVTFAPIGSPPSVPRTPKSIALLGTVAWLIDDRGASQYDLSSGSSSDVAAPAGGTFADVAGGITVAAPDGSQYVVGGTRASGTPSALVYAIDVRGNGSWLKLTKPRLGASATWVSGRGLVVAGGSAEAAGVEVIGPGQQNGSALAYAPDASVGAGAVTLDAQHVLVAGGTTPDAKDAGARAIDLGCASQCTPTAWSSLPAAISPATAFAIDSADGLVVGDDSGAATHVYRLTTTHATEVATKVAHTRARATLSPLGSIVVFGGAPGGEIESFTP